MDIKTEPEIDNIIKKESYYDTELDLNWNDEYNNLNRDENNSEPEFKYDTYPNYNFSNEESTPENNIKVEKDNDEKYQIQNEKDLNLKNVKVVLERLPSLKINQKSKLSRTRSGKIKKFKDKKNLQPNVRRYCSKCDATFEIVWKSVCSIVKCKTCRTPLLYKCVKCEGTMIKNIGHHLRGKCDIVWNCKLCDYTTKDNDKIRQHRKRVHTKILKKCSKCDKTFKTNWSLNRHIKASCKSRATIKFLECTKCASRLKNIYCLQEHKKYCSSRFLKRKYCNFCTFKTFEKAKLINHLQNNHPDNTLCTK